MQTKITAGFLSERDNDAATNILRRCVHCGFCNNACPTYLQTGDERNGPRGRIYQMKRFLEGETTVAENLNNLDLCLTCQACESACPSGVDYLRLLEIARPKMARQIPRSPFFRARRKIALAVLLSPKLMKWLFLIGRRLTNRLPRAQKPPLIKSNAKTRRRAILFDGCVQAAAAPQINWRAAAVLSHLGIAVDEARGFCCGALELHLESATAKNRIRKNVDRLFQRLNGGATTIISTASGCGRTIADYGRLLSDDEQYAKKAATVSGAHRDIGAFLAAEDLQGFKTDTGKKIAFHCPCTLQYGQKQADAIPRVLEKLGLKLLPTTDEVSCCGSAGFYSLENPAMSKQLRDKKLAALTKNAPDEIITANIGCHLHLQSGVNTTVRHWIELLEIKADG